MGQPGPDPNFNHISDATPAPSQLPHAAHLADIPRPYNQLAVLDLPIRLREQEASLRKPVAK